MEILNETDPATGELCVKQYRKERHGEQRRIRLIHRESLLAFLDRRARAQNALHFAPHVNNPHNEAVETVLNNFDLFELFLGEINAITSLDWEEGGRLSTRAARIQALRSIGLLVPIAVWQQAHRENIGSLRACPRPTLLDLHFSLRTSRRVNNDHPIDSEGRSYEIARTKCKTVTIIHHPNRYFWVCEHPPKDIWPTVLASYTL